jgi:hypothetical protein
VENMVKLLAPSLERPDLGLLDYLMSYKYFSISIDC